MQENKSLNKYYSVRKKPWFCPWFVSGTEGLIGGTDYDGGDFGYDVIEMALVDIYTLTQFQRSK